MVDPVLQGRCERCGFDATDWDDQDTANTLRQAGQFIELWADGLAAELRPPAPKQAVGLAAELRLPAPEHAVGTRSTGSVAVHELWHHLDDLYRLRLEVGRQPAEQRGVLQQLSASGGGVPKLAVQSAEIGWRGLVGDVQAARRHHGRPWQALCLWSGEVIDALAAEGHPIHPGAAGENLTVRGVDWSQLRAGMTMQIGLVRCRLSAPAVPCAKNNRWFADGDSSRIGHDSHPGWSRWYASVVEPGLIETGAVVNVGAT